MRNGTSEDATAFAGWILDSMSSGILAIDSNALVVHANAGARRVLGLEGAGSEICGRPCSDVLSSQPGAAHVLIGALSGDSPLSRGELELAAPSGQLAHTIGFTLTTVRDAAGDVRGAAMVFRDLTPFEHADEQVRLRDRLAALGEMAAGLAHSIRNPLAGMEVLAGLLKRRLVDRPDERALVDDITRELRHVADTVSDALEFVRPVVPSLVPVDLLTLAGEAVAIAKTRVEYAGEVVCHQPEAVDSILADPDGLRTLLTDLVVNAFEAMEGEGDACLVVSVESRESRRVSAGGDGAPQRDVVISIRDNGPGIPDEIREKIFYPFFTTKQTGSGVGLASAQKVVASHGGTIGLDSAPGKGAAFRIQLPVHSAGDSSGGRS